MAEQAPPPVVATAPPRVRMIDIDGDLYQELLTFDVADTHDLPQDLSTAVDIYESYRTAQRLIRAIVQIEDHREEATRVVQERDNGLQTIRDLNAQMDAITTALAAEQTRSRQLHGLNVTLSTQLNNYQGNPNPGLRPARIPDPDKFDGTRDKLRPFLTHLRLKLSETNAFADEQARLRYTVSRLEGIALEQVTTFVTADGINFDNVEALVTHLNTCFDDPDRIGTATHKLQTIRQGNRQFSEFYAEFQRYALQSNWDNAALHATLRRALSYELRSALAHVLDEPVDYVDLANLLTRIDQRQRALKQDSPRTQQTTTTRTQNQRPATAPAAAPHPTSTNSGHYGPAPMDLSAGRRKLAPEERLRRLSQGLCLYCGGAGHLAADCTDPGKRRLRAAEANLAPLQNAEDPATDSESKN